MVGRDPGRRPVPLPARRPGAVPRPRLAVPARRGPRAVRGGGPGRVRLDRRRVGGARSRCRWRSTSCTSAPSRPRGPSRRRPGGSTRSADLGVTAVELLPLNDFPGRWGWGYDGVALFAPARCYGGPDDLRRLVDRAHVLGLGILIDVVYNHFGPDGNYTGQFSAELRHARPPDRLGPGDQPRRPRLGARPRLLLRERPALAPRNTTATASGSTPRTPSSTTAPGRSSREFAEQCRAAHRPAARPDRRGPPQPRHSSSSPPEPAAGTSTASGPTTSTIRSAAT